MITKDFVLAGDAIFTVETPTDHYTYRVQRVEPKGGYQSATYFVKLLTGPDNTRNYTYMGKLLPFEGQLTLTAKSRYTEDAYPVRLLNRILARVWSDDHAAYESKGYKTHHEGRCGRCGRLLTVPESIENGIGPECAKIMAMAS